MLLLSATFVSGCSTEKTEQIASGKDISMFITTDIHYLSGALTDRGKAYQEFVAAGDGRQLNYINQIVSAFGREVRNKKPDILIISGDLTNNGEKKSHTELAQKLKEMEESGTRIYVIPGNHDILNPWAIGFQGDKRYSTDSITARQFKELYWDFGYSEAISKDKDSLSYLAAPSEDLWLLMLDTNEYEMNDQLHMPTTYGELREGTLAWIKKCSQLAKEKNARIIAVMHHNLFNHSAELYYGFTLDNSDDAIDTFKECGIDLVLSGHIHIQDIKTRTIDNTVMNDVVTSSLAIYPIQYGILQYRPEQGFEYSTSKVDVESWAADEGVKDEKLLHFSDFTRKAFGDASYQKAMKALKEVSGYTDQEKEEMAETMSELNLHFFSGTTNTVKEDIMKSKGYKLWRSAEGPERLRDYVLSMLPNRVADNNHLIVPTN